MRPDPFADDISVRALLKAYPATTAVFDRHGLLGCGGPEGPDEPLAFFARAHHVDLAVLRAELIAAIVASEQATAPTRQPSAARPAAPADQRAGAYRRFLATSLLFALTAGGLLGVVMLANLTGAPGAMAALPAWPARVAHAHAQVFGFAALFIMGVAYHALPRLKASPLALPRLADASFGLQAGGVLLIVVGAFLAPPVGSVLHIAGAVALLLAALAFGAVIDRTLAGGTPAVERFEPWLRSGCAWLVVAAGFALAAAAGVPALQPAAFDAALYGFVASWILGFSLRILPVFMGLDAATGGRVAICAVYQSAVLAWVGATAITPWHAVPVVRGAAAVALCAAVLAYVARLGLFARRAAPPHGVVDRGYERFIVAAYGWLLVWLVCVPGWSAVAAMLGTAPPPMVVDFGRHAFTLGFLTQMIIGVATRIIPVFSGASLWSARLRNATFWLLTAALVVRAGQVVVSLGGPPALWPWIALSGPLALAGFIAFTINIVMTVRSIAAAAAQRPRSTTLDADATVAAWLTVPGALELLVARGFAPLRNPAMRAALAHTITLRQACRMQGLDLDALLAELTALRSTAPAEDRQTAAR